MMFPTFTDLYYQLFSLLGYLLSLHPSCSFNGSTRTFVVCMVDRQRKRGQVEYLYGKIVHHLAFKEKSFERTGSLCIPSSLLLFYCPIYP